jgi:hypothetical protein
MERRYPMIQPVLSLFLMLTLTLAAHAQPPRYFTPIDANTQSQWTYAAVHFRQANDLAKGLCEARFNEKEKVYVATVPKVGSVKLTATQQSMTEGNAIFSARIWTADQDYACLIIESTVQGTIAAGYRIARIEEATQTTQPPVTSLYVRNDDLSKAEKGQIDQPINAIVRDIHKGDRICFLMTNTGNSKGSNMLQTWNLQIIALPLLSHDHP